MLKFHIFNKVNSPKNVSTELFVLFQHGIINTKVYNQWYGPSSW